MKTTKTNALAVLSVVVLLGFTLASSASSRHRATFGWNNVNGMGSSNK